MACVTVGSDSVELTHQSRELFLGGLANVPEIRGRFDKFNGDFSAMPIASAKMDDAAIPFGRIRGIANHNWLTDCYARTQNHQRPMSTQR